MVLTDTGYSMMLLVQKKVYDEILPDEDGWYIITRKEFIKELNIAPSTFSKQIINLVNYYMKQWDLCIWFGLLGLGGENLYTDISYEKGKLRFKRNPYTLREELSYVWGRKPIGWEKRSFLYEDVPVPDSVKLPIKK